MALIDDPDALFQGTNSGATVTDAVWGTPTGRVVTITSATNLFPTIAAGDYIGIRDHSDSVNNGLYKETGGAPGIGSITMTKVTGSGSAPIANAVGELIVMLGDTTEKMNIFYDTAVRGIFLLEQNGLGADGVLGQSVYSKAMIDWKDDAFLIAAAPFPILCIDADAGKYFIGLDASGNNNGWNWVDSVTPATIRTRKLLRSMGWAEVDINGVTQAIYFGAVTLGTFEDSATDTAYYQFGTDTTVDDTVDFDFAGPVNEAVAARFLLADGAINGGTGIAIDASGRVLTRSDGGNWRTDGFIVGGRIEFRDAENATSDGNPFLMSAVGTGVDGDITIGTAAVATANGFDFTDGGGSDDSIDRNDGLSWIDEGYFVGGVIVSSSSEGAANDFTATITTITASSIGVATATVSAVADDNSAVFSPVDPTGTPDTVINAAVDNLNAVTLRLRIRDGDPKGKTFSSATLASGNETVLGNRVYKFPVANATDQKIDATDAAMSGAPYSSMSITIYSTPQSLGADLVGGPFNFGFQIDAATGTSQQVYEFINYQLRLTTDIDADADAAIGRSVSELMRFVGDNAVLGLANDGITFPTNPQGGGSGVYVTNLNAASKNSTTMYDNLGAVKSYPVGTPVTLDFNQVLIDDTVAVYTLFFDYTIRTTVGDLIITAGTGADGTFDSVGANLVSPQAGAGTFIRVTGGAGADAAMDGIYQVTALTSTSQWDVTRYDGATIVTTTVASLPVDEHPVDSPASIIVDSDVPADVTGTASADYDFTFDYTGNVQGGRTGGTDADVICKAIGQETAQYTQSTVQTITSGTQLTIPVSSVQERNFNNS